MYEKEIVPKGDRDEAPPAVSHITKRTAHTDQDNPEAKHWQAPLDQFFGLEMGRIRQELEASGTASFLDGIDEFENINFAGKAVLFKSFVDVATAFINCEGSRMGSYELWRSRLGVCQKTVEEYANRRTQHPQIAVLCTFALLVCEKLQKLSQTPEYRRLIGAPDPADKTVSGISAATGASVRKATSSVPDIEVRFSAFLVRDLERCHAALEEMDKATDDYRAAQEKFLSLAKKLMDELTEPERIALEISPLAKRFQGIREAVQLFEQLKE